MNKENKENMGERPSRSILKNDTTLPLLPSTNRLNRRVSFHPEVTLHKINFVPVQADKRRETIAIIPLLRDNSDSGNSSIESRDDSNSTSDDNTMGTARDDTEQNQGTYNDDNSNKVDEDSDEDLANFDGNDDEGEEETMELTGQFVPNPEAATDSTRDNDMDKGNNAIMTPNDVEEIETLSNSKGNDSSNSPTVDSPPYYQDEEEGDMELTSNIGLNYQNIIKTVESSINSEKLNVEQPEQNIETREVSDDGPEINSDNETATRTGDRVDEESMGIPESANDHKDLEYRREVNNCEDMRTVKENEYELEETMDITRFYSHINIQNSTNYQENDQLNQEITMDMTRIYHQENRTELINELPDTGPIMQDNESQKVQENESIMEFTQELGKINISDLGQVNQLGNIQFQEVENETIPSNESEQNHKNSRINNELQPETDIKAVTSEDISNEVQTGDYEDGHSEANKEESYKENKNLEDDCANQEIEAKEIHSDHDDEQSAQQEEGNISNQFATTTNVNETIQNVDKDTQDYTYMESTQIEQDGNREESAKTETNHEGDQPSQKMQLTQEYGEIKQVQLKRTLDDVEELPHKYPKIDNNDNNNKTITTTIPLADISTDSIEADDELDPNYIPVSLNDFLKDISIRFYDDLEIGIKSVDRISISLPKINNEENYKFDDFVSAMNKMPLLELYEFSCKELTKNIKDGTMLFDQFNQFTMENNPRLFKQYYLSTPNEKLSMKSQFQLIKDYTRHQAKEVWYGWRTQLIKNLIIQLDEKHDTLVQDKLLLLKNLTLINRIHEQLKIRFDNLSNQLNQLLQIESHCNDINSSDLVSLRDELTTTCKQFKENQQTQTKQKEELNKLNSIISDNKALINAFTDEINEVEKSLNTNKKYELSEIELLKLKFNFLQSFTNLNYKYMEGTKLVFHFMGVEVAMDFKDIHDLSNISYSVDQNSSTPFKNSFIMTDIAPKLFDSISGSTIIENFQNFKKHWSVLKSIDEDIYAISWKLPIIFIETQDNVIDFKIRYYCGKENFKVELFISIDISNLLEYPNNLKIKGQLIRSNYKLSQQTIITNFLNDCVHNALVNKDTQIIIDGI